MNFVKHRAATIENVAAKLILTKILLHNVYYLGIYNALLSRETLSLASEIVYYFSLWHNKFIITKTRVYDTKATTGKKFLVLLGHD